MTKKKRLHTSLALVLAGSLLWAPLSWAQCRGGGGPGAGGVCPVNQSGQKTWQGRGQGNGNCPYYSGYGRGSQGRGRGANAQGFQGQRGQGRNAPNTSANQPNASQ
jgi:hypothetical protein